MIFKCWQPNCPNQIEYQGSIDKSGDYFGIGGVIHVGWHKGELLTSASCTYHMLNQLRFEWDRVAGLHGYARALRRYGPRPKGMNHER